MLELMGESLSYGSTEKGAMHMPQPHFSALLWKHSRIDGLIATEMARPHPNELRLAELKKRKLRLKDALAAPH